MKYLLTLLVICSLLNCANDTKKETISQNTSQEVIQEASKFNLAIYDYDGLEPLINKNDNRVHVVNFWATWCKPCVKELPYFEEVRAAHPEEELEVLLVSLDFPTQYESKLKPFIADFNLKSEVVVLDDPDMNSWIPKISEKWSGSIPATIIYNKDKRVFYERSFSKEELKDEIQNFF